MVEFHKKWGDEISAIKLVAKETKGVATAITATEDRAGLADHVINLVRGLKEECEELQGQCSSITRESLTDLLARDAYSRLGFTDPNLVSLCNLICLNIIEIAPAARRDIKATPPPDPKSPPPTSPPRRKASAKKR